MTNPTPEHQQLVRALINHFKDNLGYEILPLVEVRGNIPDIIAKDQSGLIHIAEAETSDSLGTQETTNQFNNFSNLVMSKTNIPVPFHIIVYKSDYQNLVNKLISLGLFTMVGNRITVWTL